MNKQWRDEIATLRKHRRKVCRDFDQVNNRILGQSKKLEAVYRRQVKAWLRQSNLATNATRKAVVKIDRRIAILEGRLS